MHNDEKFDFRGLGKAIKEARESRGMTREKPGEIFDLAPRYIMSIENKGQHPGFQGFYELASFFHISGSMAYLLSHREKTRARSMRSGTLNKKAQAGKQS